MGNCSSRRPHQAPPVPEETPQVVTSSIMQAADTPQVITPQVEEAIQIALADESETELLVMYQGRNAEADPALTANDVRRITDCLQENPRLDTLDIFYFDIQNDVAALNVLRDGLPLCTSITTVRLLNTHLGNEGLERLLPTFYNTSVTSLHLDENYIQGHRGGELIRDLLIRNNNLFALYLSGNPIGPEGAIGLGKGLSGNDQLQKLNLRSCNIGTEGLANLLLFMGEINKNSLTYLYLSRNGISGEDGGRQLLTLLLQRCPALKVLDLGNNHLLGPLGARALAPGLAAAAASHLEELKLGNCNLGNVGVANLPYDGQVNNSLTNLDLTVNDIQGADGGRQLTLLLQRFPALKALHLDNNHLLGPLGARALAPGLAAAASHLEDLRLYNCGLGNDGVANLVPDGQVNRSLTNLDITGNGIRGTVGIEIAIALATRCTNLDRLVVDTGILNPDQQRRLDLLLERKRLCTKASALAGSTFSVLFRAVEEAHRHEQGLSAIFVILQNDGEDYFCTANNRAIE